MVDRIGLKPPIEQARRVMDTRDVREKHHVGAVATVADTEIGLVKAVPESSRRLSGR